MWNWMFFFALQAGNAEKDGFSQIESDQIKTAMYEDCIYIFENYSSWQNEFEKNPVTSIYERRWGFDWRRFGEVRNDLGLLQ